MRDKFKFTCLMLAVMMVFAMMPVVAVSVDYTVAIECDVNEKYVNDFNYATVAAWLGTYGDISMMYFIPFGMVSDQIPGVGGATAYRFGAGVNMTGVNAEARAWNNVASSPVDRNSNGRAQANIGAPSPLVFTAASGAATVGGVVRSVFATWRA